MSLHKIIDSPPFTAHTPRHAIFAQTRLVIMRRILTAAIGMDYFLRLFALLGG